MKKRMLDYVSLLLLGVVVLFFLYQKGYIFADFETLHVKEAYTLLHQHPQEVLLLDVRSEDEYDHDGRIEGARLVPLGVLEKNLKMLPKEKKILVYCRSGSRSISASRLLQQHGFQVYNINGGINAWRAEGLPVL